jgi:hypothetical protein
MGEIARSATDSGRIGWISCVALKLLPQKMFKAVGS